MKLALLLLFFICPPSFALNACLKALTVMGFDGKELETVQDIRITSANIGVLFNHEYADGKLGCKALTYVDGQRRSSHTFWASDTREKNQVQHIDALRSFLDKDIAALQRKIDGNKHVIEFQQARAKEAAARKDFETAQRHYQFKQELLMENSDLELDIKVYRNTLSNLIRVKPTEYFKNELAKRMLGFELTAERVPPVTGELKVTVFGVSSMITRMQTQQWQQSRPDREHMERFANMIVSIHDSIAPSLRAYDDTIDLPEELHPIFKTDDHFMAILTAHGLKLR